MLLSGDKTNQNIAQAVDTYYLSLSKLTPQDNSQSAAQSNQQSQFGTSIPITLIIYTPILIFILLFIAAFGVLTFNRVKNYRSNITMLVIALFAACTPFILRSIQNDISTTSKAAISDIPSNLEIKQLSASTAQITWTTTQPSFGAVKYSEFSGEKNTDHFIISNEGKAVIFHHVILDKLKKNAHYGLRIYSNNYYYDNAGVPIDLYLY